MALNRRFLSSLSLLFRARSEGTVEVLGAPALRAVHVLGGRIVGARSNVKADLLGEILVAEGRLDSALLLPMEAEARAKGRLFGAQLVAEGLFTAEEVDRALVRQIMLRFQRAATMAGNVVVIPLAARGTAVANIAAAVLGLFQSQVPFAEVEELASGLPAGRLALSLAAGELPRLELDPGASEMVEALGQPFTARELLLESTSYESAMRFLVAMDVLGYLAAV